MDHIDYTENLFQAIDTIIADRLKKQQYDETVIGHIVDNSQAKLGRYKVTENNQYIYTAISTIDTYNIGDEVYILKNSSGDNIILMALRESRIQLLKTSFDLNDLEIINNGGSPIDNNSTNILDLPNRVYNQNIIADLNTVLTPGTYQILTTESHQILNIPHKTGGTLRVWTVVGYRTSNTSSIAQEFVDLDQNFWYRQGIYHADSPREWTEWINLRSTQANKQMNSPSVRRLTNFSTTFLSDGFWHTAFIDNSMITASLSLFNFTFTKDNIFTGSNIIYSPIIYLSLPFPMTNICLTGVGNQYGIAVTNVNQDGYAGVYFRLSTFSSVAENQKVNIRLNLTGELAKAPLAPDGDWTNYDGCNPISGMDNPINIIQTYLDCQTDGNSPKKFIYTSDNWHSNNTSLPYVNNENGAGCIVCDTFIDLILRGIEYNNSPYVKYPNPGYINFSHQSLPVNLHNIPWVENLNLLTVGKTAPKIYNPTNDEDYMIPNEEAPFTKYFADVARYTYHYLWVLWQEGLIFTDINEVRSGDLAFWVDHSINKYFDGVTHIGMVTIENNEYYLSEVTAYNYTVNGEVGSVLRKIPLRDKVPQPTYFGRIDYRSSY